MYYKSTNQCTSKTPIQNLVCQKIILRDCLRACCYFWRSLLIVVTTTFILGLKMHILKSEQQSDRL